MSGCGAHIIGPADPRAPEFALLMARHEADCTAESPPGSCHRLAPAALAEAGIVFLAGRVDGVPVSMGALKRLTANEGEVKSMHVLAEWRGRGLARDMLSRLAEEARCAGLERLFLETGAQPIFAAARGLYAAAGFAPCPPFAGYRADPASRFMTIALQ